jgi:hypothetical protein
MMDPSQSLDFPPFAGAKIRTPTAGGSDNLPKVVGAKFRCGQF